MATARKDPIKGQRIRDSRRRCYENGGNCRQREAKQRQKAEDFFGYHIQFVRRFNPSLTAADLERLWESQNGLCGLTGQKMEASPGSVHVDHIIPSSRGGGHGIENLRWVTAQANLSKRDMTDDEFLSFCKNVVEWIARRIAAAEAARAEQEAA